jgi:hypothetical protein
VVGSVGVQAGRLDVERDGRDAPVQATIRACSYFASSL